MALNITDMTPAERADALRALRAAVKADKPSGPPVLTCTGGKAGDGCGAKFNGTGQRGRPSTYCPKCALQKAEEKVAGLRKAATPAPAPVAVEADALSALAEDAPAVVEAAQ